MRRFLRRGKALGVAVAFAVAAGCASGQGAAFPRAMSEADDAAAHGDLREASRRFDEAAKFAVRLRDRDEARHAAARLLGHAGDIPNALARLDVLAAESPPGSEAGGAAYDAAALRLASGDEDAGWRGLEAMLRRFPGDGDARPALHRWLTHLDETGGPAAALAWLRRVQPALAGTDRAEEVAYEIAVRLARTNDLAGAHAAFLAVAQKWPYPQGALWDDALYQASLVDEARGQPREAIADLEQMLSRREHSWIVGSYERPRYAESELRIGRLYRDGLGDHASARRAFHALFTEFPGSTLRDRGLFEEAELFVADGNPSAACARLETLVHDLPDSRYAPCAVERCPSLRSRPAPTAARTCHAYLDRKPWP